MIIKRLLLVLLLVNLFAILPFSMQAQERTDKATLSLNKTSLGLGDEIAVTFSGLPEGNKYWIGVIPSDVVHGSEDHNDKNDIMYKYVSGRTNGVEVFQVYEAGKFDIRISDPASKREIASQSFEVKAHIEVKLESTEFAAGEEIVMHYKVDENISSNSWVGIVPADIPHGSETENDKHDLAYKYFNSASEGVFKFIAPSKLGDYNFRFHDQNNDGKEVKSVNFKVVIPNAELKLEKTTFLPGENITLTYKVDRKLSKNSWIGIIPSSIPHGSETENDRHDIQYKYPQGTQHGVMTFKAPSSPGSYDIRWFDTNRDGNEIKSITITVQ